jgi:tetratricopeptide (TPR) repeat protein
VESRPVISNLEKLLSQGRDSALLRFSLGSEYLKLHEIGLAISHLQRSLEMDPNYSAAWKLLGMALTEGDMLKEALNTYRRGIETAQARGDQQAAKEMTVYARRLEKRLSP